MRWILLVLTLISCNNQDDDMKLFISNLSSSEISPQNPFPIEDDGYLYVFAMGQSNMIGIYPEEITDDYQGDKTESDKVFINDNDNPGSWKIARFGELPFVATRDSNNIALSFCVALYNKYPQHFPNGIRILFSAASGQSLDWWVSPNLGYTSVRDKMSDFGANIKPASLWLFHQGEGGYGAGASYQEVWDTLESELTADNVIKSGYKYVFGQLGDAHRIKSREYLEPLQSLSDNYIMTPSYTLELGDFQHFLGTGLSDFGDRYLSSYEDLIFENPKTIINELSRPTSPTVTVSEVTSTTFRVSWTASTPVSGKNIVAYYIYTVNGWIKTTETDEVTLTAVVDFRTGGNITNVWTGPTEYVNVVAVQDDGVSSLLIESTVTAIPI